MGEAMVKLNCQISCRNISFSGLDGEISSSFANLKAVQYLYVWSNGSVSKFLLKDLCNRISETYMAHIFTLQGFIT
jgi:hypothetical protein